jgi:hypothetical protein
LGNCRWPIADWQYSQDNQPNWQIADGRRQIWHSNLQSAICHLQFAISYENLTPHIPKLPHLCAVSTVLADTRNGPGKEAEILAYMTGTARKSKKGL